MSDYLLNLRKKVGRDLLPMAAVSIVTFDDQGRVLMVKHTAGGNVWVLPGGSIDPPELHADAAVREMWEETGLLIEPVRILGVYNGPQFHITYQNGDKVAYNGTVFEGNVVGGSLRPDGVEVTELAYVSQQDLASLNTLPWVHIVLADVFKRAKTASFQPPMWQPPDDGIREGGISDFLRQIRQKVGNQLMLSVAVGTVVYDERGYLLLQKRADNGLWTGPAGGLEPFESPADGAMRETWEETGIIARPTRILGVFGGPNHYNQFSNGDKVIAYGTIFECQAIGGTPTPDGHESTDVKFFPLDDLPLNEMSPRWAERIDALTTHRSQPFFDLPSWQPSA